MNKKYIEIKNKLDFLNWFKTGKEKDLLKFGEDSSLWEVKELYDSKNSFFIDLMMSCGAWHTLIIDKKTQEIKNWSGF